MGDHIADRPRVPGPERARRATISGPGFAAGKAHVVRAAPEAMAHRASDLKRAFAADGRDRELPAHRRRHGRQRRDGAGSGGHARAHAVERPRFAETTALVAATLTGVGAVDRFEPGIADDERRRRLAGWSRAMRRVLTDDSHVGT